MSDEAPLVNWDRVGLVYDAVTPVVGLQPTSLAITQGSYTAITGSSGAGKSSLLSVLGLLSPPSTGRYELAGRDIGTCTESERASMRANLIGFVFQAFHLVPSRTALDNVALGVMYQGVHRIEALERASDALERVGLYNRRDHRPAELSGGQSQRVAIARAIAGRPRLLLADEPTGNLDRRTSGEILDLFDELRVGDLTVVVVTHSSDVASRANLRLEVTDGDVTVAPNASAIS